MSAITFWIILLTRLHTEKMKKKKKTASEQWNLISEYFTSEIKYWGAELYRLESDGLHEWYSSY